MAVFLYSSPDYRACYARYSICNVARRLRLLYSFLLDTGTVRARHGPDCRHPTRSPFLSPLFMHDLNRAYRTLL